MFRTLVFALPLTAMGSSTGIPTASLSSVVAAPMTMASATTAATTFRMPSIAAPQVGSAACKAVPTIRLTSSTPGVSKLCIADGKILVNGKDASDFVMQDVKSQRYGPLMRGENVPNIHVQRVSDTQARADATLGLGLVNVSNGIGKAVFRDLVWIGDKDHPAINSDDAWGAITLKGKDANDVGTFEISNFDFQNLFMAPGSHYLNVDGISTEAGYSGTISNGRVLNASDACLDIKGDVRVDNVYLAGCRQGIKAWTSQSHGLVELGTNRFVGIIGKGSKTATRTITIDVLIASGDPSVPLFRAEDGVVNLHVKRLIAKPGQVLNSATSYSGSKVTVDQQMSI
ncbi:hypothetical protein [Novosphingobium sp.]|uniref:hypothetical protein n=1 Tax=Novosphingobium sp. TaxID=1874826 RepID=UPI002FE26285